MKKGKREEAMLLVLKMEEGAMSQEISAIFRIWKSQENKFFLRASRRNIDLSQLDFSSVRLILYF